VPASLLVVLVAGMLGACAAPGDPEVPAEDGGRSSAASPSPHASESGASEPVPVPTEPAPIAVAPTATPPAPAEPPSPPAPAAFDSTARSLDDPTSLWVVTDKLRPLAPLDYVPPDLVTPPVAAVNGPLMRSEAASALVAMFAAGTAEGAGGFQIQNAYRSFSVQTTVHDRIVAASGAAVADAQSARPGYSEHQTGLAADLVGSSGECSIQQCFGTTPQGVWLAANAWRFGFVLRYPEGKTDVTGYIYEPWHFRYVGAELAAEMRARGVTTLEEFFALPAAPDYAG
jgi:D-alanyl-D-alanine carboxypeptidase